MKQENTAVYIENCARCGQDHMVNYKEFESPPVDGYGATWSHWAICPVSKDPIAIMFLRTNGALGARGMVLFTVTG